MASSWDEIKRLAADLQRAQLGDTQQRLSERNCIEIVTKLIEKDLIKLIFTTDGKEYLTPEHALKEITDELHCEGGRIDISVLSTRLRLDYSIIEERATVLVTEDDDTVLSLGHLMHKSYLDRICEEINNKLTFAGVINISECAEHYDLSPQFLYEVVGARMGTIVHGQPDPTDTYIIFNESYIGQHRARARGVCLAALKPVLIHGIINRYKLLDRLFFTALNELVESGQLKGAMSGGRLRDKNTTFVPAIYTEAKYSVVDSFYKQNNYFDYTVIGQVGLGDPHGFIRKHYKQEDLLFLKTCAVSDYIIDQITAMIEEQLTGSVWVDITTACPSFFSDDDVRLSLPTICSRSKELKDMKLFCDTILIGAKVVDGAAKLFDDMLKTKAEQAVQLGQLRWDGNFGGEPDEPTVGSKSGSQGASNSKKDRKEERRRKAAAGGRSGGGTQGREAKTKSTKKKKARGGGDSDNDDDDYYEDSRGGNSGDQSATKVVFLTLDQIVDVLKNWQQLQDCPVEVIVEIAKNLEKPLTSKFEEMAREIYKAGAGSNVSLRKSHSEVSDKVNGLVANIHLFARGIKLFDAEDARTQLHKHLLKTLCTDVVNHIFVYLAQENLLPVEQLAPLSPEKRVKMLQKLPKQYHDILGKLNNSINGKDTDDFFDAVDAALSPSICDMMVVKKQDKKKEKQLLSCHRADLLQQLDEASDPALVLHLATLVLFYTFTQSIVHASGKFVPLIIAFLKDQLTDEQYNLLHDYQDLVIKHLTVKDDPVQQNTIETKLSEMTSSVKETAINTKK